MPNTHIKTEIFQPHILGFIPSGTPRFVIAGGAPNGRVSWQVTVIRHDPLILEHPIIPEVEKGPGQIVKKSQCIFAPLCL